MGVMISGIGTLALFIGKVTEGILKQWRKRMNGLAELSLRDHTVIFGYSPGETEFLIRQILSGTTIAGTVVLCAENLEHHPLEDLFPKVEFIRGKLNSEEVLRRACVSDASHIVVHGGNDDHTIRILIAVLDQNKRAHIVATLKDPQAEQDVRRLSDRVECLTPVLMPLVVQTLEDPGASRVVAIMCSNTLGDSIFHTEIPQSLEGYTFGEVRRYLDERYEANAIALATSQHPNAHTDLNPARNMRVIPGMILYYLAPKRLLIEWNQLPRTVL